MIARLSGLREGARFTFAHAHGCQCYCEVVSATKSEVRVLSPCKRHERFKGEVTTVSTAQNVSVDDLASALEERFA